MIERICPRRVAPDKATDLPPKQCGETDKK